MLHVTTKLELDVMMASEILPAFELAVRHCLPAVVVHPQLVAQASLARLSKRGRFKIITTVDWPKGELYGIDKFRNINTGALDADGFEIFLTGGRTKNEMKNEIRDLTTFIRQRLSQTVEVRFVLGALEREVEECLDMCRGLDGSPIPSFIRTDLHTKGQISKFSPKAHNDLIERMQEITATPIKISGNIDNVKFITQSKAQRYAVSVTQLEKVIKELTSKPEPITPTAVEPV